MLWNVLRRVDEYCPKIAAIHLDKDPTELSAIHVVFPNARSQLCYWHAIQYLKKRLAEDKPPAKYDPRIAHKEFTFVDPTWAPGITSGWLEGVHEDDAEHEEPEIEPAEQVRDF
jgi:hypothetical protein